MQDLQTRTTSPACSSGFSTPSLSESSALDPVRTSGCFSASDSGSVFSSSTGEYLAGTSSVGGGSLASSSTIGYSSAGKLSVGASMALLGRQETPQLGVFRPNRRILGRDRLI